jgi:hypothetical protein
MLSENNEIPSKFFLSYLQNIELPSLENVMKQEYKQEERNEILDSYSKVLGSIHQLLNHFRYESLNDIVKKRNFIEEEYGNDLVYILKRLTKLDDLETKEIIKNIEKEKHNRLDFNLVQDISREDLNILMHSKPSIPLEFILELQRIQIQNILWRHFKLQKCSNQNIFISNLKYLFEFHTKISKQIPLKIDIYPVNKMSKKFTLSLSRFIYLHFNDYKSCLCEQLIVDSNSIFLNFHPDYIHKKLKKVKQEYHKIFILKLKYLNHFKMIKEFHQIPQTKPSKINPLIIPNSILEYLKEKNETKKEKKKIEDHEINLEVESDSMDRKHLYFFLNFTNELWNENIKRQMILEFHRIKLFKFIVDNGIYLSPSSILKIERIIPGYKYQKNKLEVYSKFYQGIHYPSWDQVDIEKFETLIVQKLKEYKQKVNQLKMIERSLKEIEILKPIYKKLLSEYKGKDLFEIKQHLTLKQFSFVLKNLGN